MPADAESVGRLFNSSIERSAVTILLFIPEGEKLRLKHVEYHKRLLGVLETLEFQERTSNHRNFTASNRLNIRDKFQNEYT